MSTLPASLLAPRSPQVNLIPPEVASRRAAGRARGFIFAALIAFLLLLGGLFYWANAQRNAAESDLNAALKAKASLDADIATYAEVPRVAAELSNATNARLYAGATEIRWEGLISGMRAVMPEGIDISTASFTGTPMGGIAPPLAGPFASPSVGSMSFSAVSDTYPDIAKVERALNRVKGLTDAQIPSVSRSDVDGVVTYDFAGTVTVTAEALDFRFTPQWFVARNREMADSYLDELVAADAEDGVASDASAAFTDLSGGLAVAEAELVAAVALEASGDKGGADAVAAAQPNVDSLSTALDALASAVLAVRDAEVALMTAAERVAAAGVLIDAKETQLANAEAALDRATTGRGVLQADVDYYTTLVSEANDVFDKEMAVVDPAFAALREARRALASATEAALTALESSGVSTRPSHTPASEPGVTPTPAPTPAPTASPTASPSPSTTAGGV